VSASLMVMGMVSRGAGGAGSVPGGVWECGRTFR
jgi:hypothetical protein